MTPFRPYVTIGAHHAGPHVDALKALAERCGADVIIVEADPACRPHQALRSKIAGRIAYAGMDRHQRAPRSQGWNGSDV